MRTGAMGGYQLKLNAPGAQSLADFDSFILIMYVS
jgi:hypothetical protein